MAGVLAFATWDQAGPARAGQFDRDVIEPAWDSDEAFVEDLEAELPADAAVMQIPYVKFPEGYPLPGAIRDHDPFRGYLHSESLRWSYGAMKGRSADVVACLREAPVPVLVDAARAWGFDAIWLDRAGFEDAGEAVVTSLSREVGTEPLESENGRFAAFLTPGGGSADRIAALEEALPSDGEEVQDCAEIADAAGVPVLGPA
jgi:phosphoglycerol transferase